MFIGTLYAVHSNIAKSVYLNHSTKQNILFEMPKIAEMQWFYVPWQGQSDWFVYIDRFEQFFNVNDVPQEKRKAMLLISISRKEYKILRDVCHPALPKEKSYSEIVELLSKQFVRKPPTLRERHRFYNAHQRPTESVTSWFIRINQLSINCKLGEKQDDILLDRFISGLKPSAILDRLFAEEGSALTLQEAFEIATNKESALDEG